MSPLLPPLTALLRDEITRRGPISFQEFMARALYDPAHGYYASGKARVGRGGDFFTNVSVGPLFGRLLARQFAEMWSQLGCPPDFAIVEQGAHQGDFAGDALAALQENAPDCFAATTYWVVEPQPKFQEIQRNHLAKFPTDRLRWVESLDALPNFTGVHFSNELIDAFPVHRVVRRADAWQERAVSFEGERLVFVDAPISSDALIAHLALLPNVSDGYETEVNLAASPWIAELASKLSRGYVLAIDYGYPRHDYYRPERNQGTLSAYAAHQREDDPLTRPGEIDLTAHVDFTTVAESAKAAGLRVAGFTDQHHFMVGLGRIHFTDTQADARDIRAFKTLMHPNLMGRSFHALCLAKGIDDLTLSGFQFGRNPSDLLFPAQDSQRS